MPSTKTRVHVLCIAFAQVHLINAHSGISRGAGGTSLLVCASSEGSGEPTHKGRIA